MGLQIYTIEENEQWDSIVRTFLEYDTYWLSGYVKAFQIHGDGEPLLFYYEDTEVRGINIVMKRDIYDDKHFIGKIEKNTIFDFSTPYGYGGWIIEGGNRELLFKEYEKWCNKNGIICEFVRFHPVIKNHEMVRDCYEIVPLGNTVMMDLSSPEIIWENITSKNRNMIRKARKNGIKIYSGRCPELYETFRKIYNSTMDKDHAEEYYYFQPEFYDSVCEDLPQNAQLFYAVLDGKIVAASIILAANRKMNYHLSGSLREYSNLAPTNLLLYEAALWGTANGYETLYLGGGVGSGEDSLFKFKKAFYRKDDLNRFYIGKKIYDRERYNMLVDLRKNQEKHFWDDGFFPAYRSGETVRKLIN
jgi:hypothetical protein